MKRNHRKKLNLIEIVKYMLKCPFCSAPRAEIQLKCEFCNSILPLTRNGLSNSDENNKSSSLDNSSENDLAFKIESLASKLSNGSFTFSDLKHLIYIEKQLPTNGTESLSTLFLTLLERVHCEYVKANSLCLHGQTQKLFSRFAGNA